MIEKTAPSDVRSAMEIPEFRKAIDEELKTINKFHTYDLFIHQRMQICILYIKAADLCLAQVRNGEE